MEEYKAKKLVTSELLANADLDGINGSSDEDQANAILDQMLDECKAGGPGQRPGQRARPPPAV